MIPGLSMAFGLALAISRTIVAVLVHHDVSGREHLLDRLLGLGAGVLLLLELCVLLDQTL